jgi:hypothetical protein
MSTHTKFFLVRDFIMSYVGDMGSKQKIGLMSKNEL